MEGQMAPLLNHQTLADVERHHILLTLSRCDGNRTRAAEALGISIRCLRIKLHQYSDQGFEVPPHTSGIETQVRGYAASGRPNRCGR